MAPPLSPLEMSVQSADGLVLKRMLEYPEGSTATRYPLAMLLGVACLGASSRDDPFSGGANATTWSAGLSHVNAKLVPGTAHGMAICYDVREDVLALVRSAIG